MKANNAAPPAILVVDDDSTVRDVVDTYLKYRGFRVLAASSGAEALAISRAYPGLIELTITDVKMPGMSGRELVERLLADRPAMRVLYISGYPDEELPAEEVEQTLSYYLAKPFQMSELQQVVQALLA